MDEENVMRRPRVSTTTTAIAILAMIASLLLPGLAVAQDEPRLSISPPKLNFGGVDVGASKVKMLKVRNRGTGDLEVGAIAPCDGTSLEYSTSFAAPATIAPKGSINVEVAYSPGDTGTDSGCLTISSSDPRNPEYEVSLSGRGVDDTATGDSPDIDLQPDSLDFGAVPVGGSRTLKVKVKNKGGSPLEGVMVGRCFETSEEYTWSPTDMFAVPVDENVKVEVTYSPIDEAGDDGCLEIISNDPDENPAVLEVTGAGGDADGVDLDIFAFKVKRKVVLGGDDDEPFSPRLWVKNESDVDGERTAIVIGMQADVVVYEEELPVSDRPGDQGKTPYRFPEFEPTEGGEIIWAAVIEDDDPDVDEAFAVTWVEGSTSDSTGLDLDVVKIRATKRVSLASGRRVRLRAWVRNEGAIDELRAMTLTGVQGGIEVYSETVDASDVPGDDGATRFGFPPYVPESDGDILWTLVIADDDPDEDVRSAVTRVRP
jgi:hypothetical protein